MNNPTLTSFLEEKMNQLREYPYEVSLQEVEKALTDAYLLGVKEGEGTKNGVQRYQMGYKDGKLDGLREARECVVTGFKNEPDESKSDWFYGYGFNACREQTLSALDTRIAEVEGRSTTSPYILEVPQTWNNKNVTYTEVEIKITDDPKDEANTIKFFAESGGEEILRVSKGGFFYKGQRVDDVHEVYERFNEWLTQAEMTRREAAEEKSV
jgi:hypothetical protein